MIGFDLKVDKENIENQLMNLLKEAMPTSKLEVSGFEVSISVIDKPKLTIKNKIITTNLPIAVSFIKNAALFTVQGHGKLNVELKTIFDVNPSFHLTTKSSIQDHTWIEKPVIDFGSLDVTVEKLIDLVLAHYNEMIASSIDKSIKDTLDLNSLVQKAITQMHYKLKSFNFKGLNLYIEPSELLLEPLDTQDKFFRARGSLRSEVAFATDNPLEDKGILLRWVESLLSDNTTYILFDITEKIISDLLCEFVNKQQYGGQNLVCDACTVDFKPSSIAIKLKLIKPIEGIVTLKGSPRYSDTDSKLYIDDLDISLKASNFIYKLTAPLVNKFLASSIKENLPIDVDGLIKSQLLSYYKGNTVIDGMQISHAISSVNLAELKFNEDSVSALMKINESELSLTL